MILLYHTTVLINETEVEMIKFYVDGSETLLFDELTRYENLKKRTMHMMRRYGYKQILTPVFEDYDMYKDDSPESRRRMTKVVDHDGQLLVLRPDATKPITKLSANSFPNPNTHLKFCYATEIFRENVSQTFHRRNFLQAGVEYLGNASCDADAEIIALGVDILRSMGLEKIHIDLGHSGFLNAFIESLNLSELERAHFDQHLLMRNRNGIKQILIQKHVPEALSNIVSGLTDLYGDFASVIKEAYTTCVTQDQALALANLEEIKTKLEMYDLDVTLNADLLMLDQMGYYSGCLFQIYTDESTEPIISGGRYDKLSKRFGVNRPACGFGANLNAVLPLIEKQTPVKTADLLIRVKEANKPVIDQAQKLRSSKVKVDILPMNAPFDPASYTWIAEYHNNHWRFEGESVQTESFYDIVMSRKSSEE